MQLEVGMYVRTKRDGIGKIISLSIGEEDECCFIELSKRRTGIKEHNILKASHNIIDLIEVGDYVNGVEIVEIDNDPFIKGQINLWTNIRNTNGFGDIEIIKIIDKDIRTIVTKEQFESMSYKVGE